MKIELSGTVPWVMLFGICLGLIFLPIAIFRHWRGRTQGQDWTLSGFWYRSDKYRRGHTRALPVVFATGIVVLLFGLLLFVIPPVEKGQVDYPASIGLTVTAVLLLALLALYWTAVLFAAPRFLIAPHLRGQQGVLAEGKRDHRRSGR